MKQIISINGNIGAGKTTLMERLRDLRDIETGKPLFDWIPEPIEEWTPWLNLFYADKNRYAFSFQMRVLLHQMERYEDVVQRWNQGTICDNVLFERDPIVSHHVFAQSLHEEGDIHPLEMDVYREFYRRKFHWIPHHAIYLQVNPTNCMSRMIERARGNELGGVTIDYLEALHEKHERIFVKECMYDKVSVINANQPRDNVFADLCSALQIPLSNTK